MTRSAFWTKFMSNNFPIKTDDLFLVKMNNCSLSRFTLPCVTRNYYTIYYKASYIFSVSKNFVSEYVQIGLLEWQAMYLETSCIRHQPRVHFLCALRLTTQLLSSRSPYTTTTATSNRKPALTQTRSTSASKCLKMYAS